MKKRANQTTASVNELNLKKFSVNIDGLFVRFTFICFCKQQGLSDAQADKCFNSALAKKAIIKSVPLGLNGETYAYQLKTKNNSFEY